MTNQKKSITVVKFIAKENIDYNNHGKRGNNSRYCGNASCYTYQESCNNN